MNELQQEQVRKLAQQFRDGSIGRRDFLRQVVALGIATSVTYSLLGQAEVKAQTLGTPTTMAVGEEGQPDFGHHNRSTTLRVGEEDVHQPPQLTTYALGEEDPHHGNRPTTKMVGEENHNQPPQLTTRALGEEGQHGNLPTTERVGEEDPQVLPPQPSTRMLGEEGNTAPPQMSTRALGEEDNVAPVYPQQCPQQQPWNGWNRW